MEPEQECPYLRFPTLVTLCQRAAWAHVDVISSLGDDLPYSLVKPILERCSIEQLLRLEQASPHLQNDTAEIWRDLCFRKYCLMAQERYSSDDNPQEPDSWRSRWFILKDAEAKRMEDAASKLRSKRFEGDERKKEKAVKYTDRLPIAKRPKTGSGWNAQPPKTLFQKAKIDASKRQQAFTIRVLPPAPTSRNYRGLPPNPTATLPLTSPTSATSSRVTVNTVIHRRSTASSSTSTSSTAVSSNSVIQRHRDRPPMPPPPLSHHPSADPKNPLPSSTTRMRTAPATNLAIPSKPEASPPRPIARSVAPLKKDPMASLFVPKRLPKAQAQRPV